jgi:hypothetical protein
MFAPDSRLEPAKRDDSGVYFIDRNPLSSFWSTWGRGGSVKQAEMRHGGNLNYTVSWEG